MRRFAPKKGESELRLGQTQPKLLVTVHSEHANRRATGRRLSDYLNPLPLEVVVPNVLTGMKQHGDFFRLGIDAR